jgi:hypothetical protein
MAFEYIGRRTDTGSEGDQAEEKTKKMEVFDA